MFKQNGVCFSECWYMVQLMRLETRKMQMRTMMDNEKKSFWRKSYELNTKLSPTSITEFVTESAVPACQGVRMAPEGEGIRTESVLAPGSTILVPPNCSNSRVKNTMELHRAGQ